MACEKSAVELFGGGTMNAVDVFLLLFTSEVVWQRG